MAYYAICYLAWGYPTSFLTILSNRFTPTTTYHFLHRLRAFPSQGLCSCCFPSPPHHSEVIEIWPICSGLYKCQFLKKTFSHSILNVPYLAALTLPIPSLTTLYPWILLLPLGIIIWLSVYPTRKQKLWMKAGTFEGSQPKHLLNN